MMFLKIASVIVVCLSPISASAQVATVALTFDVYPTTYYNAVVNMQPKGLVGTFFVDSDRVGLDGNPTRDNLILMAALGWEIGARVYGTVDGSEANMVGVWNNNRDIAMDRLNEQKEAMHSLGFDIKSIAASQRAWSSQLRGLASHLFENVRVVNNCTTVNGNCVPPPIWQSYPIPDRLWVKDGATNSLSAGDTAVSLCAQLDALIADAVATGKGKAWFPVVHKVDDPASADPNYTISISDFDGFTSCLQNRVALGKARVVTFRDAMNPP